MGWAMGRVRPSRRWALLAALAAVVATAVAIAASQAAQKGSSGPRPALVTIVNLTARSAVGSYCVTRRTGEGTGYSFCADKAYPLDPLGSLPAPPNAVVRVDVRRRVQSLEWGLIRRDGSRFDSVGTGGKASPVDAAHRRWRLRLPADLQGATDISLFVKFRGGDANFWAGLRPVERWP